MNILNMKTVGLLLIAAPFLTAQTSPTNPVYSYSVPAGGFAPNGNLMNYTDSASGTWSMQYDSLNRLKNATSQSAPYNDLALEWQYDSFGNRLSQTPSGSGVANAAQSMQYGSNNRISSSSIGVDSSNYDAAGNLKYDGLNSIQYDAENRVCAVQNSNGTITQYLYNPEGQRVAKGYSASGAGLVCPAPGDFIPTEKYILGPSGEQITELRIQDGTDVWQHTNVYANGELLATYDQQGSQQLLHFNINDPLGTKRVQASGYGVPELTLANLAYGDGLDTFGTGQDATEQFYTGKERDAESGLDYFGARYYGSSMGRFSSPDPSGLVYADPTNPQSLNLYSYVLNNPLKFIDPSGMACVWDDGSFDSEDDKQTGSSGQCGAAGGTWLDKGATASLSGGQDWSNKADSYIADAANFMSATVTPPAQGTNLLYDQQVATDQQYLAQRQTPSAPTSAQYIQAIQKAIAPIPNVCAFGAAAYLGVGGRGGLGLSADTQNGVRRAGGASLLPGGSSVSFGGSNGNVNYAAPVPGTPFLAYVGTHNGDPNQIQSVGVGTATKSPLNVSVYADIGTFGDPNCK